MVEDTVMVVIGAVLIVAGFFYTGSFDRAFGRGTPDNPPTIQMRVLLAVMGAALIAIGATRILSKR